MMKKSFPIFIILFLYSTIAISDNGRCLMKEAIKITTQDILKRKEGVSNIKMGSPRQNLFADGSGELIAQQCGWTGNFGVIRRIFYSFDRVIRNNKKVSFAGMSEYCSSQCIKIERLRGPGTEAALEPIDQEETK